MKLKKFIAILSVATMTAGLAVGCGSSSDSGSSDSSSADSKSSDWDSSNDITIVSREDGSGTRLTEKKLQSRTSKMENIKSADHLTLQQRKVQIMKWQKTSSLIS